MTAADRLYAFPRKIDLGLERVRAALAALGNPHHRVPPIVHVAGTNGKGSTVAFLRAIAEAAGQKAHVYTSPHLVRIHERWRVAGELISEAALNGFIDRIEALSADIPVTVFEAETLIAFLAFAEQPADVTLLEVGLGGRLDATNVVEAPHLTIITPVDMDHAEMLGDTLGKIAAEKAGILKPGVRCIVGRQQDEALAVIRARAEVVEAPLLVFGQDWDAFAQRGRLVVQTQDRLMDLPAPSLAGAHQFENAGAAALAMSLSGHEEAAIARGVSSATWPARLQPITSGPFGRLAQAHNCELWLDGGHNPHGARAAAAHIAQRQKIDPRPFALVAGLLSTKDRAGFFEAFTALDPVVVTVPVRSSDAGVAPAQLALEGQAAGLRAVAAETPLDGLEQAIRQIGPSGRILICGSLYLAGDVLSEG
jgi:dihydrofolate synthase / folylpolyglutamate synthase